MAAAASSADSQAGRSSSGNLRFLLRGLVVAAVVGGIMSLGNVNIGAIGQGLAYGLAGVTVYMTFRVLGFVDLTVDGAFPIGAATCAVLIVGGQSPKSRSWRPSSRAR